MKFSKLLLIVLLSFTLVGCGKEEEPIENPFDNMTYEPGEINVMITGDKELKNPENFLVLEEIDITPTPEPTPVIEEIANETNINYIFPENISVEYKNQVISIVNGIPAKLLECVNTIEITPAVKEKGELVNGYYLFNDTEGLKEIYIFDALSEEVLKETLYMEFAHAFDMYEALYNHSNREEFVNTWSQEWNTEDKTSYDGFAEAVSLYFLKEFKGNNISDYPFTNEYIMSIFDPELVPVQKVK